MPPKVTDTRPANESNHKVEAETAAAARRVVASYAESTLDGVTLMCMLGIEPNGLNYAKFEEDFPEDKPAKKKATKKSTKKTTKKSTKAAKKTTKKSTKSAAKKSTSSASKKASSGEGSDD